MASMKNEIDSLKDKVKEFKVVDKQIKEIQQRMKVEHNITTEKFSLQDGTNGGVQKQIIDIHAEFERMDANLVRREEHTNRV